MATDDKLDLVLGHLDKLHAGIDAMGEKHDAITKRLDALEGEREKEKADAKTRADAEAKEREEKEKADASKRRADAESKSLTEDRAKFADAQMRADAAYQAWGKQAPHALHAETLRDFKIRLLRPLQQHSKRYAQSALDLIGDDAAFQIVNDAIINDAVEASSDPATVGPGALREITTRDKSGHVITKFVGDPAVTWAPMMGGATKFGRISRPKSN